MAQCDIGTIPPVRLAPLQGQFHPVLSEAWDNDKM